MKSDASIFSFIHVFLFVNLNVCRIFYCAYASTTATRARNGAFKHMNVGKKARGRIPAVVPPVVQTNITTNV